MVYPIAVTKVDVRTLKSGDVVRIQPHGTLHVLISDADSVGVNRYRFAVTPDYESPDLDHGVTPVGVIDVEWDGRPTSSTQPWIGEIHYAEHPLSGETVCPVVGDELYLTNGDGGEVIELSATHAATTVAVALNGEEKFCVTFGPGGQLTDDSGLRVSHLVRYGYTITYPGAPAAPELEEEEEEDG